MQSKYLIYNTIIRLFNNWFYFHLITIFKSSCIIYQVFYRSHRYGNFFFILVKNKITLNIFTIFANLWMVNKEWATTECLFLYYLLFHWQKNIKLNKAKGKSDSQRWNEIDTKIGNFLNIFFLYFKICKCSSDNIV